MLLFVIALMLPSVCRPHGYLLVPPQRSSFWRERSDMPRNYNDNQLNCGGYGAHWDRYKGKCGVCGDPYSGPLANQPPFGKYATGVISRCYKKGTISIDVKIVLTSNHLGTIQFRLCEHNDVTTPATHACFDKHQLQMQHKNGLSIGDVYRVSKFERVIEFRVKLPKDLECEQCILQWTYAAGNNWGCDVTGCGLGHGAQEQFINCADVSVLTQCPVTPSTSTSATFTTKKEKFWISPVTIIPKDWPNCKAANEWTGQTKVDKWCVINCPMGYCPETHCFCPDLFPERGKQHQ